MKIKPRIRNILSFALVLTLVGILGTRFTFAQTVPVVTVEDLSTFDYAEAPYFSSDWRIIESGENNSFSFEYAGRNQPVMVWMEISTIGATALDLEDPDSAGFEIWTPELLEQQAAGEDVNPVGVGLPLQTENITATVTTTVTRTVTATVRERATDRDTDADTDADTDSENITDTDRGSIELFWYANLRAPATFVVVVNGDPSENLYYMLNISGTGLVVPPGTQLSAEPTDEGAAAPAETAAGVVVNVTLPSAPDDENIATVLATFLNVREGPSLEFPIITTVPLGTQVVVVGRDATDTWLAIQLDNDQIGWVSRGLMDFTGAVEEVEVAAAPVVVAPPAPATVTAEVATVIAAELNVRQGPAVEYPIITTIDLGVIVTVTGRNEDNTWIQVDLGDGRIGWVDRSLTDYAGVAAIVEAPPLAEIEAAGVGGDEPVDPNIAFVVALALNLREGPSTAFAVITTLEQGAPLTVLGRNAANNWLLVETEDGIQGWVSRTFTNFVEIADVVEAPESPETTVFGLGGLIQPAPNVASVTSLTANMRQGPSIRFPVILTLARGTVVGVVGSDPANNWLLVEIEDGTQGWVTRGLTNFAGTAPILVTPPLPITPATPEEPDDDVEELPADEDVEDAPVEEGLAQNWFALSEDETQWFSFYHPGNDEAIHIWMEAEPSEGAGFRIFDVEQTQAIMEGANPDDFSAIGRGTPNPAEPGNLFWRGVFAVEGLYYVMVEHSGEGDVTYAVYGAGPGLE